MTLTIIIIVALIVGYLVFCRVPEARNRVHIIQGDITQEGFECIVNAANRFMLGGGGVDGAIHRAAGPELKAYCCEHVPVFEHEGEVIRLLPGEAFATPGFNLCKTIIHTVGPIYNPDAKEDCADRLADCYFNSLQMAFESGAQEVAFPVISSGIYGYPLEGALFVALSAMHHYQGYYPGLEIYLVTFDKATLEKAHEIQENMLVVS